MSRSEFLSEELRRGASDHPWHGPSTAEALHGVTAAEAAAHPIAGAHSIWELVLHLTAWNGEARRRLLGGAPAEPEEGDWPAVPEATEATEATEASWQRARERLFASVSELRETLAGLADEALDRPGGSLEEAPGTGGTLRGMVDGVVQHLAYHSGQIMLLQKALIKIH